MNTNSYVSLCKLQVNLQDKDTCQKNQLVEKAQPTQHGTLLRFDVQHISSGNHGKGKKGKRGEIEFQA
jgi:hypothetical protein